MADPPQDEEDANSQISTSRGSSIAGPYRQAKVQNTFPRCHLVHSIYGSEETYSRSLLSTGNGFAFWDVPGSHIRGPTRLEQEEGMHVLGVSIGDVGIIDPNGQYIFGFNIFTPAADPLHQGQVPDDFEEVEPVLDKASEIEAVPDFFKPGTIISSKAVNINRISEEPLKISLRSSAREGAVLVLPHGGSREDLKSTSRLTDYIERHALEWYRYLSRHSKTSASMVPNGSLFLVTGCDRAKSFCAVAFPSKWKNAGKHIEMTYEGEEYPSWTPSTLAREKNIDLAEGEGRQFCVFARGIHISISNRLWARHLPYPSDESPYYNVLSTPILGFKATLARYLEHFMRKSDAVLSGHQKFPFHPSSLISQVLLEQHPTADIALVEDSVWRELAKNGHPTLPEILETVVNVILSCEAVKTDRLVKLVPKTSDTTPSEGLGFFAGLLSRYTDYRSRQQVRRTVERVLSLR